ncbi:MAG: M56 family metallopeptidase, partial [Lachnospiraceae bacterium]|nr:M56 family metallopeptidase [Lachnospiraceae bacterium]
KINLLPKRGLVFLWIIPAVRGCIPFGISSRYSLMSLISRLTTRSITVFQPSEEIKLSMTNAVMAADSYFPITYKENRLEVIFGVAAFLWIIIATALLITLAILYVTTKREVRDAEKTEQGFYLSEKVSGPAVYGILRPRILLPAGYVKKEGTDLKYVLQHEKTHIRRGDNLWRMLGFFLAVVHWFNPLSWIFLKAFLGDVEMACDEAAIAKYEEKDRKEYARTLLDCAQGKSLFVSAFGGAKVRTRIENILSYRKMTILSSAGFTALIIALLYVLLTNAG